MINMGYLLLGLVAGVFSGFFGVGGGSIMIPAFVFIFGLTQHQAQGMSLGAMLPPVFLFAAWRYYQVGHINIPAAAWVSLGILLGGLVGAHYVQFVPDQVLKKVFGCFLLIVSIKMVLG